MRDVEVQGHRWAFVGGPIAALAASQDLAGVLGPVGLSVLQQVMTAGSGAAWSRLVQLARDDTAKRQAQAIASAPAGAAPDVISATIAAVRETMGVELAGQVLDAVRSPDFRAWCVSTVAQMTRDGVAVDPADPEIPAGELLAALWEVGKAEAVFR